MRGSLGISTMPKAQLDPDLKIFRNLVQSGITPTEAYRRVYAATRKISYQACRQGGLRYLAKLDLLNIKPVLNTEKRVAQRVAEHHPKPKIQLVEDKELTNPRKLLLKRLWEAVNSQANSEAIAAVKQLRDWIREDEQAAQASQIADPAVIAGHVLAVSGDYAALDTIAKADYCRKFVDVLDSLGLPRADLHAASADFADRDFAPPPAQPLDSIAPNKSTPSDTLPITPSDITLS